MSRRAGAFLGVAALVGLGGYAALPDDAPDYLGDMPSIIEQAEAAPALPEPFVPPPADPAPPRVEGPDPVDAEAPAAIGPPVGERVPAPVTDTPRSYRPGESANGEGGPSPALIELPVIPCVDIFRPGLGTFDCLTGELLLPDPDLPVDCTILDPLPIECPLPPD